MRAFWKRMQAASCLLWHDITSMRIMLAVMILYVVLTQSLLHTVCPVAYLFHIPCPACGLTRSAFYVLTFQWHRAWKLHAAIFLWLPYLAYLMWSRYWRQSPPVWGIRIGAFILGITLAYYGYRLSGGLLEGLLS